MESDLSLGNTLGTAGFCCSMPGKNQGNSSVLGVHFVEIQNENMKYKPFHAFTCVALIHSANFKLVPVFS